MILDGGPCEIGLESTIVGFEGQGSQKSHRENSRAIILRPGGIPLAALAEVLNGNIVMAEKPDHTQRVPGALASHYAPATPLELCAREYLPLRSLELELKGVNLGIVTWSAQCTEQLNHWERNNVMHFPMPPAPESYGRLLYATLRRLDNQGFDRLLIEALPDEPEWMAVMDRLRRASCNDVCNDVKMNSKDEAVYG